MATSVATAFDDSKITPTDIQKGRVRDRASTAERYLRRFFGPDHHMPVSRVTLAGSAARDTQIRPLDDLDVLADFSNKGSIFETYRGNSQLFINRIRNTLNAKTQIARIGTRGQAVRLFYDDGLHVDIAPVFAWSGGGYALPAGDGSWMTTDPFAQQKWADERQSALGGRYKRRVRMLKRWNSVHGRRLDSYHLEVVVGNVFSTMGRDSRDALQKFFQWAPTMLHVQDPAGHGGDLASGMTYLQEQAVRESLASAEKQARKANQAEAVGNNREAIRLWRIALGEEFPAYG